MPCFHPVISYRSRNKINGKYIVLFGAEQADLENFKLIRLPCRKCIWCRLDYSRVWAVRCVHESSLYKENCFITLTFNSDNLRNDWSLCKDDYTLFMKRFREKVKGVKFKKKFSYLDTPKIRYFHCGEYGDKFGRPHYHALIFGFDFRDKKPFKRVKGNMIYTSEVLKELWPFGYSSVAEANFDTAAYVARYCTKKIDGKLEFDHYVNYVDLETGEYVSRVKEYATMSRNPGIGKNWYDFYKRDIYDQDQLIFVRNNKAIRMRPPKYYDSLYEIEYPEDFEMLQEARSSSVDVMDKENTRERLKVKEFIMEQNYKRLVRTLDYDT